MVERSRGELRNTIIKIQAFCHLLIYNRSSFSCMSLCVIWVSVSVPFML
jgi:hypothetical protein